MIFDTVAVEGWLKIERVKPFFSPIIVSSQKIMCSTWLALSLLLSRLAFQKCTSERFTDDMCLARANVGAIAAACSTRAIDLMTNGST